MKVKQLQSFLQEKKVDAAIFLNLNMQPDPNFFYLTRYAGHGCLVVPNHSSPYLLVAKMEHERANKSAIRKIYPLQKKKLFEELKLHLGKMKRLGIDASSMTLQASKALRKHIKTNTVDVSKAMDDLRIIKTREELTYLKRACAHADTIFRKAIKNFKDFKTESDVAAFLQYETFKLGLDTSFKPIVASGKNGSMPHHEPQPAKLNKGLCVIDFGVTYEGYCSDMTRTISIGNPSPREKQMYELLKHIQQNAIDHIKKNMKCGDLYNNVVKALGKQSTYFTHGLGHGIGVEIHEAPNLTLDSKDMITPHMVFTIEPGVYFPTKFGIRIEDSVLFTEKPSPLTKTTKELISI
jgi:Xaa-Pro aminopeptidase